MSDLRHCLPISTSSPPLLRLHPLCFVISMLKSTRVVPRLYCSYSADGYKHGRFRLHQYCVGRPYEVIIIFF
jgi:hypothetical protein